MPKFELGEVVVTPNVYDVLNACGQQPEELLVRHQAGDWGDVSPEERRINEQGLSQRLSITSTYRTNTGQHVTVFTRGDRTFTFVHVAVVSKAR